MYASNSMPWRVWATLGAVNGNQGCGSLGVILVVVGVAARGCVTALVVVALLLQVPRLYSLRVG